MPVGFAAQALRRANTRRTSRVCVIFLLVEDAVQRGCVKLHGAQCNPLHQSFGLGTPAMLG
jgi:hypothetical protein